MNSVKIAFIIVSSIEIMFLLLLMMAAPVWITPGYYWWSILCVVLSVSTSKGAINRMDSWDGFGRSW